MITSKTKFAVAVSSVAALAAVSAPLVLATTPPHLTPAKTVIKVALKKATTGNFVGTVDGAPVTVKCTASTASFTTPTTGLGPIVTSPPRFTGCTDTLGGTDTVRTNSTNGHWESTFISATATKPAELKLTVPKGGASVVSSILPTCTVNVAPTAAASILASYNNVSTATFKAAKLATTGTGCTTGATGSLTATYVLTPGVKIVP